MSRMSSTFGKQANEKFVKSGSKMYGGNYLSEIPKSLTLSGEQLRTSQSMKNGKSPKSSGAFAESMRASTGALEQEYIKSLQQQVYLLELENNHLRSQAVKATDLHPTMAAEAERMLQELKSLQAKVDALQMENFRKEGAAEVLQQKVTGLTNKLQQYEHSHQQERENFNKGAADLRHERDMFQRDASRMQLRLNELEDDYDRKVTDVKSTETKIVHLRSELESALDRLAATDTALADERTSRAQLEAKVKVLELELANSGTKALERGLRELRQENLLLKERVRQEQNKSQEETLSRAKNSEQASALVKRNASLEQQLVELQRELDSERDKSSHWAQHVQGGSDELLRLRERERTLEYQVSRSVEEVAELRLRNEQLSQRLSQAETNFNSESLEFTASRNRQEELQRSQSNLAEQLQQLQRQNRQLQQQVEQQQQQMQAQEAEKLEMGQSLEKTESRLTDMQAEVHRLQQLQSTRWSEVEKMADTLRSAAHSNSMLFDRY